MNIPNMEKLITALEGDANPVGFDMNTWFRHNNAELSDEDGVMEIVEEHPCGTQACLAGHAAILAWEEGGQSGYYIRETAAIWLDLSTGQSISLFHDQWHVDVKDYSNRTKEEAVAELQFLIKQERGKE